MALDFGQRLLARGIRNCRVPVKALRVLFALCLLQLALQLGDLVHHLFLALLVSRAFLIKSHFACDQGARLFLCFIALPLQPIRVPLLGGKLVAMVELGGWLVTVLV